MREWMNDVNVNTMYERNKIKSMHKMIKLSSHEIQKHITYTYFKQTIHLSKEIITNMYTSKIIKEG